MQVLKLQGVVLLVLFVAHQLEAHMPFSNSIYAEVNGVRMHYRHWDVNTSEAKGSVMLIHGFGGSTFSWQEVADSLSKLGYEVVAVDIPPFGYSDKSHHTNQSVTAHADRLRALIHEDLPGRTWHLAGHSMGGSIAQAYALSYPGDLQSVTFVAPAFFSHLRMSENPTRMLLRISPMRFILGELAQEWVIREGRVEHFLRSAYGVEPTQEQVQAYLAPLSYPGTARAILSAATFHEELRELDAGMFDVPAIAIWGDSDSWVPHTSRQNALDRMPGIELVLMENVGHNPMETHFVDFMSIWLRFLQKEH